MSIKKNLSKCVHVIYDAIYNIYIRIKLSFALCARYKTYIKAESYYQERESKSSVKIALEQISHIWKYGEIDIFYFMYGKNCVDCNYADKILNYRTFFRVRNTLNNRDAISYANILRDKMLFGIYAKTFGIKTPLNIAISDSDSLYLFSKHQCVSIDDFIKLAVDKEFGCHFVIKVVDGECGKGVFMVDIVGDQLLIDQTSSTIKELRDIFTTKARFLIQEKVIQHEDVNQLYANSVNTLRLCTIRRAGKVIVLPSVFRVGANGAIVDNWSMGGIAIGVDLATGKLRKYGLYRPEYSKTATSHPDTNILIEGFQLPDFDQAISEAIRFHSLIPSIDSIGWDIAFTADGPVFIEGNDNWEVSLNQACNIEDIGIYKDYFSKA